MNTESTPYPGHAVNDHAADKLIHSFKAKFRNILYQGMPDNVPTACTLKGAKNPNLFHTELLQKYKKLYVFIEPDELYISSGKDVIDFYLNKQPWEDYDFCIFDDSLQWCVGVTHDDEVIVVDDKGYMMSIKGQ